MRFKTEREKIEFQNAPPLLRKICLEFAEIAKEMGIEPVVTRVRQPVEGSSGVHEAGRAVDIRDEYAKGEFLFVHEQRERIVNLLNLRYSRKDKKPTCLWHSFKGAPHHFHIQIAAEESMYEGSGPNSGSIDGVQGEHKQAPRQV